MPYSECALGVSADALITLSRMGVAAPDQLVYVPGAVMLPRWDGARVWDGYASAQWICDVISASRLATLLSFLNGATYRKGLYVVTDAKDGTTPGPNYKLFTATMWKPAVSGQEGVPIARSEFTFQTVKIQFIDMVEVVA